jgi:DUF2075 family protein
MQRFYYNSTIKEFINSNTDEIIGIINSNNEFDAIRTQNKSWAGQIRILKKQLQGIDGKILFEFNIPRMGKRIDCLLITKHVVYVLEFKVGESKFNSHDRDQVWDYALDLKHFHKPSHDIVIVPILIATESEDSFTEVSISAHNDKLTFPLCVNANNINLAVSETNKLFQDESIINIDEFIEGAYHPTPTIIDAAISLYNNHSVEEITRTSAEAINLSTTTDIISQIIKQSKTLGKKSICFVTGVPGAGKTLVGLKVATTHAKYDTELSSVYLSGNGPLVSILQEALARDKVNNGKLNGKSISKKEAKQAVKSFIQIIHHYRDAYLLSNTAPYDHVAIFDEAQRAWTKEQTVKFMRQKKNQPDFDFSEPEFLISCLDRHKDWAVIVCLVGGGQEINTGEAGISEWLLAFKNRFKNWQVYISPHLTDSEYNASSIIEELNSANLIKYDSNLHLSVSMRSFRAEKLSLFVKQILDLNATDAAITLNEISTKYPIVITRSLDKAKIWLKEKARGNERYGLVVSSQAYRLKPLAIDIRSPIDPVHWFLNGKDDVRSSFYLEDVATEFQVQGLELDWVCVAWDGDLRFDHNTWKSFSFKGNKWQKINQEERKKYLINAYRVLLTRARQGMVIVIPEGNIEDHTRQPEFYNSTYTYLKSIGIPELH